MSNEINGTRKMTRRDMLKGSAVAAAAAAIGFEGLFGFSRVLAQAKKDDDIPTVLNLAATAETLATTHYYNALTAKNGIQFGDVEKAYFLAALESEQVHIDFLEANGAKPLATSFFFPKGVFTDKKTLAAVTEVAETAFIGAYLAATRIFAAAGNPQLAVVAAQVAGVEAQHLSFVRGIGGQVPSNNIALLDAIYYNVSDAVPTLTPFLDGKADGFEATAMEYPGRDAVMKLVGKSMLKPVLPATDAKAFGMGMK